MFWHNVAVKVYFKLCASNVYNNFKNVVVLCKRTGLSAYPVLLAPLKLVRPNLSVNSIVESSFRKQIYWINRIKMFCFINVENSFSATVMLSNHVGRIFWKKKFNGSMGGGGGVFIFSSTASFLVIMISTLFIQI